jgi:hypothetical protein
VGQKGKNRGGRSDAESAERRRQALELRKAGYGFEEIGRALGLSTAGAYKVVQTALKATYREPADDVRKLELERLDRLTRGLWPRAIQGETEAIDRVLKLMTRRARLLGLDEPEKHDVRATVQPRLTIPATDDRPGPDETGGRATEAGP